MTPRTDYPTVNVSLDDGATMLRRAHTTDAGADLCCIDPVTVPAHGSVVIDTGVHVELPECTAGLLVSKSGLNVVHELTSTGLIDQGYSGAIRVRVYNHGDEDYHFEANSKISQLVVIRVCYPLYVIGDVDGGERGDAGFGSTGI